jgi:hypothetical protein
MMLKEGRLKCPELVLAGSKSPDILVEEMLEFEHEWESDTKGVFHSTEKEQKGGIQDDCMYAVGWSIYGGRFLTPIDFRPRAVRNMGFGCSFRDNGLFGVY